MDNTIFVTGAAGFIGAALVKRLIKEDLNIIGIDNINDYYNQNLKQDRLSDIEKEKTRDNWKFFQCDLNENDKIEKIFLKYKPSVVVNLAAQAGVRHSINHPSDYIKSNLLGFSNILENCRKFNVKNFIYASSSSVYGGNKNVPFSEDHITDHPLSLYGATKKCNEVLAHSYSNIFNLPVTGLRFFTVYGPWGRPDMAPMIFLKSILANEPIKIFNYGNMQRDFTYIDDIVNAIFKCCFKPATANKDFDFMNPQSSISFAPYRIFNVGNSRPIDLMKFIQVLENTVEKKAIKNFEAIEKGDVFQTYADLSKLKNWIGYDPQTSIENGIVKFVNWYNNYYNLSQ